jgi:hypothetical protein
MNHPVLDALVKKHPFLAILREGKDDSIDSGGYL